MEQKYNPNDDFGSFLATVQRAVNQPQGGQASIRIIHNLSRTKQAKMTDMMTLIKVSWSDFNDSLKYLQDAGLINLEDDDEGGLMVLTEDGVHWAQTMNLTWQEDDPQEDNQSGDVQ